MNPFDESSSEFVEPNEDDTLDLPACLESISSSCEQLHQIAKQLESYHIKLFLSYGYIVEPKVECPSINNMYIANQGKMSRAGDMGLESGLSANDKQELMVKLAQDMKILTSLNSLLKILPHLNETCSIVEGCTATLELTIKRLCYYLNESNNLAASRTERFYMTTDTKLYSVFIAMMDAIYALASLDETIRSHTHINQDLKMLTSICKLILGCQNLNLDDKGSIIEELKSLPKSNLANLTEYLNSVKIVLLCDQQDSSLIQNCLNQLQNLHIVLNNDKTRKGFSSLREHFEDFMQFYCEHQIDTIGSAKVQDNNIKLKEAKLKSLILIAEKLVPKLWMTSKSRRVFGVSCIYAIYWRLYRNEDKKIARTIAQLPSKHKVRNMIPLIGSNCSLKLDQFLSQHLPEIAVDKRRPSLLRDADPSCDDLRKQFERHFIMSLNWTSTLRRAVSSGCAQSEISNDYGETCYLSLKEHLEQGVKLIRDIRDYVIMTMSTHLSANKPISKDNLIPLYRSVTLVKSLWIEVESHRQPVECILAKLINLVRIRWRTWLVKAQKRLLGLKYSTRKLSADTVVLASNICMKPELICTATGRTLQSLSLSILLPVLTSEELSDLNQLLQGLSPIDRLFDDFRKSSHSGYLYWNIPTFSTFYNHMFEEDPNPLKELKLFGMAIADIEDLFSITAVPSSTTLSPQADLQWLREGCEEFMKRLAEELVAQIKTDFLDKLCQEFEMELRIQTHRELCLDGQGSPFRRHMYNFRHMFQLVDDKTASNSLIIRLFNQEINIRYYVEQHLSKVAYNLTAIAPVDWYTYDKMMNLAGQKYHLKFINLQLPAQILDSGLDLLDITRNLGLLATRYCYDLANQLLIEKCAYRLSTGSMSGSISGSTTDLANMSSLSSYAASTSVNQSLNVIRTSHIARSIHTHGFGLLDSAVNQSYQIMKRFINTFSKQMSDEKLAAVLRRENQQVNLHKQQQNRHNVKRFDAYHKQQTQTDNRATTLISFEKVNKMAKSFKMNASDLMDHQNQRIAQRGTDLDSIRQTITQLGNLLAFIRMLRSGALSCATKSTDYVPDLQTYTSESFASSAKLEFRLCGGQVLKAAENLDQCLSHFRGSLSPQADYLSIVTELFSNLLKSTGQQADRRTHETTSDAADGPPDSSSLGGGLNHQQTRHNRRDDLRLFFLLVPALTINYIEHIISCRERVTSRSSAVKFGALVCDDGFSMGVAFLLRVLNQIEEYQQFDWLRLVCNRLNENKRDVERRLGDSNSEEALRQTSSVTLRRLKRLEREYTALDYTLRSALLLFGSDSCGKLSSAG